MVNEFESTLGGLKDSILGEGTLGIAGNVIMSLIFLLIVAGICGFIAYVIIMKRKYKYRINFFEKINGRPEHTHSDWGAKIKFGEAGDRILKTRRTKLILPMPTIQMGRRVYWYALRDDGEYINIGLKDLDEECKQMNVQFLDKEMRYARTQIQKGLKERYAEQGFWNKYGNMILSIGFILMIGVMTYLLFDKYIDLAGQVASAVQSAGEVQEATKQILIGLDNVCSGSGIVKAG